MPNEMDFECVSSVEWIRPTERERERVCVRERNVIKSTGPTFQKLIPANHLGEGGSRVR